MSNGPDPSKIKRRSDGKFDGYESSESEATLTSGTGVHRDDETLQLVKGDIDTYLESNEPSEVFELSAALQETAEDLTPEQARQAADHFQNSHHNGSDPAKWDGIDRNIHGALQNRADERDAADGPPKSYDVNLNELDEDTRDRLRAINDKFGDDYEVEVATLGGGLEGVVISESSASRDTGGRYNITVGPLDGGTLDDDQPWCAVAEYQDRDGEWIQDDDELCEPLVIADKNNPEQLHAAIQNKLSGAQAKSTAAHEW